MLLWGTFRGFGFAAVAIAGLSVIIGAVYLLRVVQRWMYGVRPAHLDRFEDLSAGECLAVAPLLLAALVLGFHPRPIIAQTTPVMSAVSAPARTIKTPPPVTRPESPSPAPASAPSPAPASTAIPSPVACCGNLRTDLP